MKKWMKKAIVLLMAIGMFISSGIGIFGVSSANADETDPTLQHIKKSGQLVVGTSA
ncbi:ABC transporter permease, partial [Lactobacillus sp. UMNPBX19]